MADDEFTLYDLQPPDTHQFAITYDVKTVDTVLDANANVKRPRITFKLKASERPQATSRACPSTSRRIVRWN